AEPAANVLRSPERYSGRGSTHDADANARTFYDRPRAVGVHSLGVYSIGVGRQKRKPRLPHSGVEIRDAVIVLMVPDRGGVVFHCVHRRDYWVGTIARDSGRYVRQRIALQQISGIEQDHATGICRSYRIDYRRR